MWLYTNDNAAATAVITKDHSFPRVAEF